MNFENKSKLKSAAELAMERVKDKEISENTRKEAVVEDEERKKEAEKSASELKEMNLKDKTESSQKAGEIRKKIDSGEMEAKTMGMMSDEELDLSFKRQMLLDELERWAKEDPVKLAKSVKMIFENSQSANQFFQREYNYLDRKGKITRKYIIDEDIRNAVSHSVEMKDGSRFVVGTAELRLNKGLKGKMLGNEWVEDSFLFKNGNGWHSVEHSFNSPEYYMIMRSKKVVEKLKNLMIHDKAKGVLKGDKKYIFDYE